MKNVTFASRHTHHILTFLSTWHLFLYKIEKLLTSLKKVFKRSSISKLRLSLTWRSFLESSWSLAWLKHYPSRMNSNKASWIWFGKKWFRCHLHPFIQQPLITRDKMWEIIGKSSNGRDLDHQSKDDLSVPWILESLENKESWGDFFCNFFSFHLLIFSEILFFFFAIIIAA